MLDSKAYVRRVASHRRRLRWKTRWPLLVWIAAALAAGWLYVRYPDATGVRAIRGVVEAEAVSVSPVETARVRAIRVTEGQAVLPGELLVEMDAALLEHDITTAVIDAMRIETAFGDTHQDVLQAVSQRLDSIAAIELDIALCRQEWQRESAELEGLRAEQTRRDDLRRRGLADETTRAELLPQIAALQAAVEAYPARITTLERQLSEARQYHGDMMEWLGTREEESISTAIARRLNQREVSQLLETAKTQASNHRSAFLLRAPGTGVVSRVMYREGDVVVAGMPLVRIVTAQPRHVTAFLDEVQAAALAPGSRVRVTSALRSRGGSAVAVVDRVGPEIHTTAYQTSISGRQMAWRARRARLTFEGGHSLLAGEMVVIQESVPGILDALGTLVGFSRAKL